MIEPTESECRAELDRFIQNEIYPDRNQAGGKG